MTAHLSVGQRIKFQGGTWQVEYSWSHNEGYGKREQCYQLALIEGNDPYTGSHGLSVMVNGKPEIGDRVVQGGIIARTHTELEQFGIGEPITEAKRRRFQVRVVRAVEVEKRYETASWFRRIKLEPGVYPMQDVSFGSTTALAALIPGRVTASAFPSSFGGHNFGDGQRDKDVGERVEHSVVLSYKDFPGGWENYREREQGAIIIEELPNA